MSEKKTDWTGDGGELDYDALLAHYQDTIKPEPPPPPREKRKLIPTLISDLSGTGKFSRKRGGKAAAQEGEQPLEEAPVDLEELKPAPRPQEGRWQKILHTPQTEMTAEGSGAELTQVLEELEQQTKPAEPAAPRESAPKKKRAPQKTAAEPQPIPQQSPSPKEPAAAVIAPPEEEPPAPHPDEMPKPPFWKKAAKAKKEKPVKPAKAKKEKAPKEKVQRDLSHAGQAVGDREPNVLEWIYIEIYYIGIQLMRDMNLLRREAEKLFAWLKERIPRWLEEQNRRFQRFCRHISDTTLFPYREIARLTARLYRRVRGVEKGKGSLAAKFRYWWDYFRSLSRPLNHIANFVAPIVGLTILAATLTYFRGINYALSVEYAGHNLGYIAEENVFYEAQQTVLERMMGAEHQPPDSQPIFHIVIADKEDMVDPETLANRIITVSQTDVEEADGVYIGGAFLGALENGSEFLIYLDSMLEQYRTGIDHELVQFIKSVAVRRGIYPSSSVLPLYRITQEMESDQTRTVEHKVEEGDTLPSIATEYNVTVEELLSLNPLLQEREHEVDEESGELDPATISLEEGEQLTVARVTMDLGVQVTRREVYTETIPYGTTNIEDSRYYKGYSVTLSSGINGEQEVTADVTYIDGEKVGETRIGEPVVLREPVNAQVRVGTMPILTYLPSGGNSSESFMWPVKGGYVSAGLYGYYGHTGMDIAAPLGTEVRAAKDGQVIYATNYSIWPFGKSIDIDHGNGVRTKYAHCSAVFVTYGQYVRQGDLIGLVGRTGNATGNHLHFEIRINGVIMNPANFIGNYWPGF